MAEVAAPALAGHQFFRGMPAEHLAFLAGLASLVTVPAGHRFFEVGGVAKHFWLIRAGQIAVDLRAPGDGRTIIQTLRRGSRTRALRFRSRLRLRVHPPDDRGRGQAPARDQGPVAGSVHRPRGALGGHRLEAVTGWRRSPAGWWAGAARLRLPVACWPAARRRSRPPAVPGLWGAGS